MTRTEDDAEYSLASAARHGVEAASGHRVSSRRVRHIYFALASAWGFVIGATGVLACLAFSGNAVRPEGRALLGLVPAVAVAVAGGAVIAGAYQEAKRRRH